MEDKEYVTPKDCELHHKLIEAQMETLRQKDDFLDERMTGIETRLTTIDGKMDKVVALMESQKNYIIWLLVGIVLTGAGVLLGRGVDFGWLI